MIFPNRLPQPSESLRQILYKQVVQRVLPLEQQYRYLISRQYAQLRQLQQQAGLEDEWRDELLAWITELQRTLNSHWIGDRLLPNDGILWALFGANNGEGVQNNIDNFCQHRTEQIEHVRQWLAETASLSGLKRQLKKRHCQEPHIARFLDESPRVYTCS